MAEELKRGIGFNVLTKILLLVNVVMMIAVIWMYAMPVAKKPGVEVVSSSDPKYQYQTPTYINASAAEREDLEIAREDFEGTYCELVLLNPSRGKVIVALLSSSKLKVLDSGKYILPIIETMENDVKSPFFFVFLSYLIASLYFPAGTLHLASNSEGVWYNGIRFPEHPSIFRRLCLLLSRNIK